MMIQTTRTARDRRPVPGSRLFDHSGGPAWIICGTRAGCAKHRRVAHLPQHYLLAPVDADPGSLRWPVSDAAGITVQTCGAPDEFVLRLIQTLLADGARLVMTLRPGGMTSFHIPQPEDFNGQVQSVH